MKRFIPRRAQTPERIPARIGRATFMWKTKHFLKRARAGLVVRITWRGGADVELRLDARERRG